MFSTHRLRLLVELDRRGTLAEVARALSYSPSTISQQLAHLEVEAGSRLLEPVGRRLRLTPAGELLVRHAERILAQIERAQAELAASRSDVVGSVRIATFQTAAISLVPHVLTALSRRYPDVTVYLSEIQPDAGTAALMARDFDLVLGEEYPGLPANLPAAVNRRPLFSDPMHLYAPEVSDGPVDIAAYADQPWVMEPRGKPARAWAEACCRTAGFEPDVRFESADLLVHAELAETGHAAALLPDLIWSSRRRRRPLVDLPDAPVREIYTAVREGAEDRPILVALRNLLGEVSNQIRTDTVESNERADDAVSVTPSNDG